MNARQRDFWDRLYERALIVSIGLGILAVVWIFTVIMFLLDSAPI